jgi:hypothetical protein
MRHDQKACPLCGERLEQTARGGRRKYSCQNCGATINKLLVCGRCGTKTSVAREKGSSLQRVRCAIPRQRLKNRDFAHHGPERFTYLPESNSYRCPAGEQLNYVGLNVRNRAHAYIGSAKRCGACCQKAQCTSGRYKYLAIHVHESARQRARELANTPEFSQAQRARKKVEALFAELKNHIGLRRLRLRRMKFVREQFFLAAAAQNIKRLVRYLSESITPAPAITS